MAKRKRITLELTEREFNTVQAALLGWLLDRSAGRPHKPIADEVSRGLVGPYPKPCRRLSENECIDLHDSLTHVHSDWAESQGREKRKK